MRQPPRTSDQRTRASYAGGGHFEGLHPDEASLALFADGSLDERTALQVANHLLQGCQQCSRSLQAVGQYSTDLETDHDHASGHREVSDESLRWARQLSAQPARRQDWVIANIHSSSRITLARALLVLADDNGCPADANRQLKLGLQLLVPPSSTPIGAPENESLDQALRTKLGVRLVHQSLEQGRHREAFEHLQSMSRLRPTAEEHGSTRASLLMATAELLRAAEIGTPELVPFTASELDDLLSASRRGALNEAQQLFARAAQWTEHARCVLQLAELILFESPTQRVSKAELDDLIQGLRFHVRGLEAERRHRLALVARHYLMAAYQAVGDLPSAADECRNLQQAHQRVGNTRHSLLSTLDEARIARSAGWITDADRAYCKARSGLLFAGLARECALSTLELAEMRLEQGRGEDLRALAEELTPLLAAGDLPEESIAALLLFRQDCLDDRITLNDLGRYVSIIEAGN